MRLTSILITALLAAAPAMAENRGVAIANGDGGDIAPVADAMRKAGFRTVSGENLNSADLHKAISDLLRPDEAPGVRLILLNGQFAHNEGDSWFLASDANQPDRVSIGASGVSLNVVMDLLREADPGAVLILGTEGDVANTGEGIEAGPGDLEPPEGVTVLSGPADLAAAAAARLMVPGSSVQDALDPDKGVTMLGDGDEGLVLLAETATDQPPGDGKNELVAPDRAAWAEAAATDSVDAYRSYLDSYPTGLYSAAAAARLSQLGDGGADASGDRDAWAEAAAVNSRDAYESYLTRFPKGAYAEAAQRRLDELKAPTVVPEPAPQPVPQKPVVQKPVVQQPVIQQPAQPIPGKATEDRLGLSRGNRIEIQRQLNALNYSTGGVDGVFGSRSRSAIRGWQSRNGYSVTGYLTASQVAELRRQAGSQVQSQKSRDQLYWEQTGARGGARNLRAYLDRYPNGAYANTARNRLYEIERGNTNKLPGDRDDRAFSRARQENTIQSYTTYLRNWPKGKYVRQAQQNRDALRRRQQQGGGGAVGLDAESIIRELLK